jgi:hypothetical protein
MIIAEFVIVAAVLAVAVAYSARQVVKNVSNRMARLTTNAGVRAGEFINTIELRYDDIVEQRMEQQTEQGAASQLTLDVEQFIEDVFVMVKPELEALLAHINTTDEAQVKVQYTSRFFTNVVALADAYFAWRGKHPEEMLSREQDEKMYTAFKDAMRADVRQRLLAAEQRRQRQLPRAEG